MSSGTVIVLGARSDIGRAVAKQLAGLGYSVQLAARRVDSLAGDKADIEVRYGVAATLHEFDALAIGEHAAFVERLPVLPDVAVCVVGYMGDQQESERDPETASLVMRSNFEGPASIFAVLANRFEARGSGTLVGISSVAGERGRASNYVYGSAKAGFTAFLSGLRNRLANSGVHVVTVLPGFVATQMTEGMELPPLLTAQPDEVAEAIAVAMAKRRNVVYVRGVWRVVMLVIRSIPELLFKRLSL